MHYISDIKKIVAQARQQAYRAINSAMVEAYWRIGERIVLEEQNGQNRAEYGKEVIKHISVELTEAFGKGFSPRRIFEMRQFYSTFPDFQKVRTLSAQLSWSHFQRVLRVSSETARNYYLREAAHNNWSVRVLDRNISTLYYDRIIASANKEVVESEMQKNAQELQAEEFIKNPVVLEFLNLPTRLSYTEAELERALIDNLQAFMLELGKGFAFVARQEHIRTEHSDFYIDLVFYNYILKCFVIVELKTNALTHQDIGQLDMYVRMYDDLRKQDSDNPTIGLLLCTDTDSVVAKYSVLGDNEKLFATKYMHYLPTEEELIREISEQRRIFEEQRRNIS